MCSQLKRKTHCKFNQKTIGNYDATALVPVIETLDKLRPHLKIPEELCEQLLSLHLHALKMVDDADTIESVPFQEILRFDIPSLLTQLDNLSQTMSYLILFPDDMQNELDEREGR